MSSNGRIADFVASRTAIVAQTPARTRISQVLDDASFMEIGAFVRQRPTELAEAVKEVPAEAVVTGWGTVNGMPVYVFSQDLTSMGGAVSEMHARKIVRLYELAAKTGNPIIGIFDSKGARIVEGIDALNGYAEIIAAARRVSGVVPQIAIVAGQCGGAAAIAAACFDFVVMTESAEGYMHSPQVIAAYAGDNDKTGSADACAVSGFASFKAVNDAEAAEIVRKLIGYLPSNNLDEQEFENSADDINRSAAISEMIPEDASAAMNMHAVIGAIADDGDYMECSAEYGANIAVCFAKLDGQTVGIVANCADIDASSAKKTASFVAFCDAFNIPVVTLVDAGDFEVSARFENGGGIAAAADLAGAYAAATIPKVTVVVRKAIGSAYIAMASKGLGADMVYAYPTAEISALSANAAVTMLYDDQLEKADDPIADRQTLTAMYREKLSAPYEAAKREYVDEIINPDETRPMVIYALGILSTKNEDQIKRKHTSKSC